MVFLGARVGKSDKMENGKGHESTLERVSDSTESISWTNELLPVLGTSKPRSMKSVNMVVQKSWEMPKRTLADKRVTKRPNELVKSHFGNLDLNPPKSDLKPKSKIHRAQTANFAQAKKNQETLYNSPLEK